MTNISDIFFQPEPDVMCGRTSRIENEIIFIESLEQRQNLSVIELK